MTVRRKKNVHRKRGSRTHGYGYKKNRGSGNRGGKGMAGSGKRSHNKKIKILKLFGNEYFGKHGFIVPPEVKRIIKAINIRDLPRQSPLDLTTLGYDKLLSKGMPAMKYEIKVAMCSAKAKEKIEKAGGKVISEEQ
jgi:large subunit ribosomal protein L15